MDDDVIDQDIAECLYAGIMTDTGNFRFNSVIQNPSSSQFFDGKRRKKDWVYDQPRAQFSQQN